MKRSIVAVTVVGLTLLIAACGGGSSKTAQPMTVPLATKAQTAAATSTPESATAAPLADFCSVVSPADVEALAGPGATLLTGDSATAVAARFPQSGEAALATCRYRDTALLSFSSMTISRYESVTATDLANAVPGVAHSLTDVGIEANLFLARAAQPFDIDGTTYDGEALILAKNDTFAIAVAVETTGDPAGIDVERIKTVARTLLASNVEVPTTTAGSATGTPQVAP